MTKKPLTNSLEYRNFIRDRDRVLEVLLRKSQLKVSDITRKYLTSILNLMASNYEKLIHIPQSNKHVSFYLDHIFDQWAAEVYREYMLLRKRTYIFTIITDNEAIARALDKEHKYTIENSDLVKALSRSSGSGGQLHKRILLSLTRLKHKVMDAASLGVVLDDSREEFIQRVYDSFPRQKKISNRRILKPQVIQSRESDKRHIAQRLSVGFYDERDWQDIVDEYKNDFITEFNGPEGYFPVEPGYQAHKTAAGDEVIYAWEVERDMTEDFVSAVREGMVDSANKNGIKEFMWIAIVDDKTDDCCLWRDGLTTSEIEKQLNSGKHKDDECRAVTPKAHWGCRCSMAPMTDDLPEYETKKLGDFDSWMNQ